MRMLCRYAEKLHEAPQPEPGTEAPASDKSGRIQILCG